MRNKNNPIAPIREYSHNIVTPGDINIANIVDPDQLKDNLAILEKFSLDFKPAEYCWQDFYQRATHNNHNVPVLLED